MAVNKSSKCRIVIDAMGGDYAPQNAVLGAVQAEKNNPDIEIVLVGKSEQIQKILDQNKITFDSKRIINADETIEMGDSPATAVKTKKDSSIVVGINLVKENKADAFVSAGNTGAVVTASTLILGRLNGVERPTIGTFMPNSTGVTTLFDVGAFVDTKPQHLLGYAVMSTIFVKEIYNISNPSVGLLTTGEEEEKGNKVTKEAYPLFKNSNLNFVGNVEGRDILQGKANIIICDGFIGNIVLKFGESVPKLLKYLLKDYSKKNIFNLIKVGLLKGVLKEALQPLNPDNYGGVPLLGVKGITIIGHGSSSVVAIKNMVDRAYEMYNKNLTRKIELALEEYGK